MATLLEMSQLSFLEESLKEPIYYDGVIAKRECWSCRTFNTAE